MISAYKITTYVLQTLDIPVEFSGHFTSYVECIREAREEMNSPRQQVQDTREEAFELEYDALNQSLISIIEPSEDQASVIQELHDKANHLVRDFIFHTACLVSIRGTPFVPPSCNTQKNLSS